MNQNPNNIIIHKYPYDSAVVQYNTPANWFTPSGQGHCRPGNSVPDPTKTPQMQSPSLVHTHMEPTVPIYGELSGNITVPFTIEMFQVDGVIVGTNGVGGQLLSNLKWNDGTFNNIEGDPHDVVIKSGTIDIDFSKAAGNGVNKFDIPKYGWFTVQFIVRTWFKNGYRNDVAINIPFFSVINTSVPEVFFPQGGPAIGVECSTTSPVDNPPDAIGLSQIVQYDQYIPILSPLTRKITEPIPRLYGYGVQNMPDGFGMIRQDMDLHHGNEGILLQQASAHGSTGVLLQSPFDPNILGRGIHKVASLWQQDSGNGGSNLAANEQATALLVVAINVGDIPPPPDPVWNTLDGTFQNQVSPNPNLYRFAPTSDPMNFTNFVKS